VQTKTGWTWLVAKPRRARLVTRINQDGLDEVRGKQDGLVKRISE
jgi:hypothetical protein